MTTPLTLQDRYKGVVNPAAVGQRFRLERYAAPPDLAPYIEWYWMVAWDLPPGVVHVQRTLPSPCIQVVFDRGRSAAFGVMTGAFDYTLTGKGAVLGARFRAGAFRGFLKRAVQTITNLQLPVSAVFDGDDEQDERSVLDAADAGDDAAMVDAVSAIFRRALPAQLDPRIERVAKTMELIRQHPEITQVAQLAVRLDTSVRALQALSRPSGSSAATACSTPPTSLATATTSIWPPWRSSSATTTKPISRPISRSWWVSRRRITAIAASPEWFLGEVSAVWSLVKLALPVPGH